MKRQNPRETKLPLNGQQGQFEIFQKDKLGLQQVNEGFQFPAQRLVGVALQPRHQAALPCSCGRPPAHKMNGGELPKIWPAAGIVSFGFIA